MQNINLQNVPLQNVKMIVAYDGTAYLGWQKTKTGKSIEAELEGALKRILQEEVTLQAASRTDRGVHADGQVVNFFVTRTDLDLGLVRKGLNAVLPKDISVKSLEAVESAFHPTLHCSAKEYHYIICNTPVQLPFYRHCSWHVRPPLKLEEMRKAAETLLGKHDFSAFCNERALWTKNSVCQLFQIAITPFEEERLRISITGDHFLYKMVRNIVGTLAYVGMGKLSWETLPAILAQKDRAQGGITAPAHGLTLKQVFYTPVAR